jgi:hypothetical protein
VKGPKSKDKFLYQLVAVKKQLGRIVSPQRHSRKRFSGPVKGPKLKDKIQLRSFWTNRMQRRNFRGQVKGPKFRNRSFYIAENWPDLSVAPGPMDPIATDNSPVPMISPIACPSDSSYSILSPSPDPRLSEAFVESPIPIRNATPIPKRSLDFSVFPTQKRLKNSNFVDSDILSNSGLLLKIVLAAVFLHQRLQLKHQNKQAQLERNRRSKFKDAGTDDPSEGGVF